MSLLDLFRSGPRAVVDWRFEERAGEALAGALRKRQYARCVALMDGASSIEIGPMLNGVAAGVRALKQAQAWVEAAPESAHARVVLARCLQVRGWKTRGSLYASDVPKRKMAAFQADLRQAQEHLLKATEMPSDLPIACALMILGNKALSGYSLEDSLYWFKRGTASDPFDFYCHYQMMVAYTAKWCGSHELMFDFVAEASANAPAGSDVHLLAANAVNELGLAYDTSNAALMKKRFGAVREVVSVLDGCVNLLCEGLYRWAGVAQGAPVEVVAEAVKVKPEVARVMGLNEFVLALYFAGEWELARAMAGALEHRVLPLPWQMFANHPYLRRHPEGLYAWFCRDMGMKVRV